MIPRDSRGITNADAPSKVNKSCGPFLAVSPAEFHNCFAAAQIGALARCAKGLPGRTVEFMRLRLLS